MMQPFVHIANKSVAQVFQSYLAQIGIDSRLRPAIDDHGQRDGYTLFCAEQHVEQAREEFRQFVSNPSAARYQQSAWNSGASFDLHSTGFLKTLKHSFISQAGPLSISVFILCWVVFMATFVFIGAPVFEFLKFNQYGDVSQTLSEPWRLITPALFHFSLLHIAFNTMWWWYLGGQIERKFGSLCLLSLFAFSALASNTGQFLVSGEYFGGLSGVVYAVFGFVWIYGYLNPDRGIELSRPIIGFMLFWLVLGFTGLLPLNVANTAHLLGLISGIGFAYYYKNKG
ncbi:rhomboid family intramembrane serine protease GlpG [Thalassotalea maritima]|uniref:rhomboid family intramembrane serine protease GlpG n=1 Tax=Thalassotalea maritima TaxID=3242416 RepID=UPI0035279C64